MLLMECIEVEFDGVKVFSLFSVGDVVCGECYVCLYIDLGVKGLLDVVVCVYLLL